VLLAELQAEVAEKAIDGSTPPVELAFAERQAQGMRDALAIAAIEAHARKAQQLFEQALTQRHDGCFLRIKRRSGQGECRAHAGNLMSGQGPGTQAALVATTVNLRLQTLVRARPTYNAPMPLGP
jgi:hypothetical protein